jgi:transcriptional regulator with XRE-family HTH domain
LLAAQIYGFVRSMTDEDLSPEENRHIATSIREELARRRMTRAQLADKAKLSLSTLEKSISGTRPFTLASVVRLEEALTIPLRRAHRPKNESELAPESMGSYARAGAKWLEGEYLTLRPSFSVVDAAYAYRTEILWDHALSHLVFRESNRMDIDYKQDGAVSVPHQSGYIYLVTNKHGQYRLAMLSRPMISGEMYGLLTTLQSGRGPILTPTSVPLVFVPMRNFKTEVRYGQIKPGEEMHDIYHKYLKRVTEEPFAYLIK